MGPFRKGVRKSGLKKLNLDLKKISDEGLERILVSAEESIREVLRRELPNEELSVVIKADINEDELRVSIDIEEFKSEQSFSPEIEAEILKAIDAGFEVIEHELSERYGKKE